MLLYIKSWWFHFLGERTFILKIKIKEKNASVKLLTSMWNKINWRRPRNQSWNNYFRDNRPSPLHWKNSSVRPRSPGRCYWPAPLRADRGPYPHHRRRHRHRRCPRSRHHRPGLHPKGRHNVRLKTLNWLYRFHHQQTTRVALERIFRIMKCKDD